MSILTRISIFATLVRSGLNDQRKAIAYGNLTREIADWHRVAPPSCIRLEKLSYLLGSETDEANETVETQRAAACVLCYGLACTIYLERVTMRRIGSAARDSEVKVAGDRILALMDRFSAGIDQLATLWPLLTVGISTVEPNQQNALRDRLVRMRCFGLTVRHA